MTRHDWTLAEIKAIHDQAFPELIFQAQCTHRENFPGNQVQRSTLLSIKTGGCSEDCAYCPQSSRYDTGLEREPLLDRETVLSHAKTAKEEGSTRFCMGAAWRQIKDNSEFEQVLDLVRSVRALDLEVCCTLGMLTEEQAVKLKEAGCYAYNHNLDSSPEYYKKIISTRTYEDRLNTIKNVRKAGITVCCGGIVGMGEKIEDRLGLIHQLAIQDPHPESVPINLLVRVKGTPLGDALAVDPIEYVRVIATTRIILPKSMVRLSAGRMEMTDEMQALCFLAGANSIFAGDKLLTTPNPSFNADRALLDRLGMTFMESAHCSLEVESTASCCVLSVN